MVDIYKFELEADVFEKVVAGKKTVQLAINDNKRKNYAVGNQITFECKTTEESAKEKNVVKATIENLLYFAEVTEAVETLGKENCGFRLSATFEKASDLFLSNENFETIEKFGIVAIIFKVIG